MSTDFTKMAEEIFKLVGPTENILSADNCMTRLRLSLQDKKKVDVGALKGIEGVLGVVETQEELQIVIGPGKVNKLKAEFIKVSGLENRAAQIGDGKELHDKIREKNSTPFKVLLKKISSIFIPLIPAFIACGLVTAILNIVLKVNPDLANTATIQILKVVGNAVFYGLNLFVGVNAAKEFGGSPMLGGAMAAVITHPSLGDITLFGGKLVPGRGGIIAVLLVVAFSSWLEKKVRKYVPDTLDLFLTPLIVMLISSFVAICALQPIGGIIADGIGYGALGAVEKGGVFTGFILGGTFLPLVMTGIHQGLTPIHAQLLSATGMTILLPILAMAGAGQVGAAIAVYFKSKNKRLKKTVASSILIGIMGVGEPLIYGVTLPLGKPFLGACIGGAFGGAVQAAFKIGATSMGLSGLPLAATTTNIPMYLVGVLVAYVAGFIATWILGFEDPQE